MVVWHSHDTVGIASFVAVLILLLFGDLTCVYYVIEYGKYGGTWRTIGMLVAHFLYIMASVSHLRATFTDPGYVQLTGLKIDFSSDIEHTEKPKKKRKKEPPPPDKWTVCTKCEIYRPPRSHHCRICGRCVRRMDHHCPWINNCVGELNFKYFFLFIFYTELMCGYGFSLIVADWIQKWHEEEGTLDTVLTICLFFEAVIFGLFVGGMIMAQVLAVACNRSAIEVRRYGRPTSAPKTPKMQLFAGVCGRGNKLFWLIPCIKSRIPDPIPPSDKMSDLHQFV